MGLFDNITAAREKKAAEKFMNAALKEAKKAYDMHEVPIGCVIVHDGKIIAKGHNQRNHDKSVLSHAEILAIRAACRKINDWRLEDCTMYVTLEPCPMCAGAIVQARIPKVVIGAMNEKAGCAGSVINLLDLPGLNHSCEVERGLLGAECSEIISAFFRDLREERAAAENDGMAEDDAEIDGLAAKPAAAAEGSGFAENPAMPEMSAASENPEGPAES